eukprot:gnl/Dysnectes_brevis/2373_a2803_2837.p1 GENE.gnl/Dysnectes_brevis/2373_a2803_2837~~gnl/Dysnectes_brevis/2373_a2803_2837.p1  ORF type:complete len:177 (-),score=21.10 gnl/Dysnectes_brevis/2373_a2803_2837:67-597(-)
MPKPLRFDMKPYSGAKRQSILKRTVKQPSVANDTTIGRQHELELERLKAKKEAMRTREHDRIKAIYGTRDDRRAIQAKLRTEIDSLVAERDKLIAEEKDEDRRIAEAMKEHLEFAEYVERDQKEARRAYEHYLLEENKRLAAERDQRKLEDRQTEILDDQTREDFFEGAFIKSRLI